MRQAELLSRLLSHFESVGEPWPWPDDVKVLSLRPGYWQRGAGAWSWCLARVSNGYAEPMWGSQWPATVIARAKAVELYVNDWGDRHIDPVDRLKGEGKTDG